jgi:hypothetical protein
VCSDAGQHTVTIVEALLTVNRTLQGIDHLIYFSLYELQEMLIPK